MQVNDVFNIISNLNIKPKNENIPLKQAFNRVLASDIYSKKNLPAFDNSALDGYAFDFSQKNLALKVQGCIFAGDTKKYTLKKGHCFKIMTGAAFPKGANSVVAIEDAVFNENNELLVPKNLKENNARKLKAEELKKGQIIIKAGTRLQAKHIMLLASQGINKIKVFARPKIALFCTGSEIKEPWQKAKNMQIYNANASGILALLNEYKCDYFGIIKDDKNKILNTLKKLLKYDLIISTGGASKGEADFMQENIENLGFNALFSSINFRPSKPTKLFIKNNKFAHILPGNPLSCYIACLLFSLPLIKKLEGENLQNNEFSAVLQDDLKLKNERDNLIIGNFKEDKFYPYNNGKFSPSQIMPLVLNNAVSIASVGTDLLKSGEKIKIYKLY